MARLNEVTSDQQSHVAEPPQDPFHTSVLLGVVNSLTTSSWKRSIVSLRCVIVAEVEVRQGELVEAIGRVLTEDVDDLRRTADDGSVGADLGKQFIALRVGIGDEHQCLGRSANGRRITAFRLTGRMKCSVTAATVDGLPHVFHSLA